MEVSYSRLQKMTARYRLKMRKRESLDGEQDAYDPDRSVNISAQLRRSIESRRSLRQAAPPGEAPPSTPIIAQEPFPTKEASPKPKLQNLKLFPDLNVALGQSRDGRSTMTLNAANGSFPSFLESPAGNGPVQRQAPSPMQQGQQGGNNGVNGVVQGMNGMGVGMPVSAGQQMDVNMVYQRLMELSEVLRDNRERTQGIVAGAEELAVSTNFLVIGKAVLGWMSANVVDLELRAAISCTATKSMNF